MFKNMYHGSELSAFLDNTAKSGKTCGKFLETDCFCLKVEELLEERTKSQLERKCFKQHCTRLSLYFELRSFLHKQS